MVLLTNGQKIINKDIHYCRGFCAEETAVGPWCGSPRMVITGPNKVRCSRSSLQGVRAMADVAAQIMVGQISNGLSESA